MPSFRKSCRLCQNVDKNGMARQSTDDNIKRRMRFARWITKATETHSLCVIINAFPGQQWLRERASMLRLYVHCLSCFLLEGANRESRICSSFSPFPCQWPAEFGTMVLLSHWSAKTDLTEEYNTLLPSEWRTTRFPF